MKMLVMLMACAVQCVHNGMFYWVSCSCNSVHRMRPNLE